MKTLILYASKHGAAAEIAKRIASKIDGAVTCDLKQADIPSLDDFDNIIIGSAIYAGSFRKEAKTFLTSNAVELSKKKLFLYISGMSESESEDVFKSNVPEDVLQSALIKSNLGGAFDPKKANFFERLIMKIVSKQSGAVDKINDEKINDFVAKLHG